MKSFFKTLGIGCLGIIGVFIVIAILSRMPSSKVEPDILSKEEITANKVDSLQRIEDLRIKDSISFVRFEERQRNAKAAKKALKTLRKKTDEFNGTSFYKDKRSPRYSNRNFIYPYIGQEGSRTWLRLKFQYASENWLFIKSAILLVDGEKFTINGTWDRDNNSGIWEWLDISVGNSERVILDKIAKSKITKVKYIGSKYHDIRTITSKEKSIIRKILGIYDKMQ